MKKAGLHAKRGLSLFNAFSIILTGAFLVPLAIDRTPAVGAAETCEPSSTSPSAGTGTVSYTRDGNFCYLAFKNTGAVNTQTTFDWTVPAGVTSGDVLVVGGGGAGGSRHAGGGGAGGYVEVEDFVLSPGTGVSVVVGAGGEGAAGDTIYKGSNGAASSFKVGANGLTALGGGFGSYAETAGTGGSGGGSGYDQTPGNANSGTQTQFNGTTISGASFGNSGADGARENVSGSDFWGGGGGGGAAEAGKQPTDNGTQTTILTSASDAVAGAGGSGKSPSWLPVGLQSTLGVGETQGSNIFFAGGGGGGMGADGSSGGPGGTGGGGDGFKFSIPTSSNHGADHTGGGGGSSGFDDISSPEIGYSNPPGADGGSGVVVVSYSIPRPADVTGLQVTSTRYADDNSSTDQVSLSWSQAAAQTPAVTGYEVRYSTNADMSAASTQSVSGIGTTTATVTGLDDGKTYYFQVFATNDEADGSGIEISNSSAIVVDRAVSKEDFALAYDESFTSLGTANVIPNSTGASFSVEAWIKPTTIDSYHVITEQRNSTSNDSGYFWLGLDNDVAGGVIELWKNGSQLISYQPSSLLNRWTHVAATVATNETMKLYVDGTLVETASQTQAAVTGDLFSIGSEATGSYPFNGEIDQVKIWSDVLSAAEVEESMHAWQADTDYDGTDDLDNLISHYDFNDSTQASYLRDMYGDNDLSISGAETTDFKSLVERPSRTGYEVYKFARSYLTSAGGWTPETDVINVEALVVGGGGAGGFVYQFSAGGGGGGQVASGSSISISNSSATRVKVGQGGVSTAPSDFSSSVTLRPSGGQESVFDYSSSSITSKGGGPGSSGNGSLVFAYDLGDQGAQGFYSGGGAAAQANTTDRKGDRGTATTDGGDAEHNGTTGNRQSGGGGGGAGGNGFDGSATVGGNGGVGIASSILGSSQFFGGGGGGGKRRTGSAGSGGSGVGGSGGVSAAGFSAAANSGGGGGGAGDNSIVGELGGNGGSGVVIIAYPLAKAIATHPQDVSTLSTRTATFTTTYDETNSQGTASYQWEVSTDGGSNWSIVSGGSGANTASYTTPALQTSDSGNQYRVKVTASINGDTDTFTSNAATLTVNDIVSSSLVLHYNASDINSYDPAVDASSVNDLSGNNYDATVVTNSGTSVSRQEQAFVFDGSESFIDGPDLPLSIDFAEGITIDFIADFESANSWERIIDFGNGEQTDNIIVARPGTETNNIRFEIYDAVDSDGNPKDYLSYEFTGALLSGLNRYTIKASHSEVILYQNGSESGISGTQVVGSGFGVPRNATRTNTYVGESNWGADEIFDGKIRQIAVYNRALSPAQVEIEYKTVSFDSNGGTDPADLVTSGKIRLPSPGSRTGYTFSGWHADETYSSSLGVAGAEYTPGDTQLHAQWIAGNNTVTFNSNYSGGPTSTTQVIVTDQPTDLDANTFTRDGYTFAGWMNSATGTGVNFVDEQEVTISSDMPLYARWNPIEYTVTFDYNGATGGNSDATLPYETDGTAITLPTPARGDAIFDGWYSDFNFQTLVGAAGASYTTDTDITLYAKWTTVTGSISPPTDVTATSLSSTSLKVEWDVPAELNSKTITGYQVEYADATNETWVVSTSSLNSSARSHNITGLTADGSFYVRVAALYSDGQGAYGYPWTKVYETTDPSRSGSSVPFEGAFNYSSGFGLGSGDAAALNSSADFTRVRYRIEADMRALGASTPSIEYVDADFARALVSAETYSTTYDAVSKLQYPTLTGGDSEFVIDADVQDLTILSDSSNVVSGHELTGTLEIWPYNYYWDRDGNNNSPGQTYDFEDTPLTTGNYGSFQLHRLDGENETIFAWNRPREAEPEIGFGNYSGTHPDWTSSYPRDEFNARESFKIESFINKPLQLTSSFTATFDSNGGSSVSAVSYQTGETIDKPTDPTKSSKVFVGWSTSEASDQGEIANRIDSWPYDPASDADFTLHAIWLDACSPTETTFVGTGTSDVTSSTYGTSGVSYKELVFDSTTDCGWVVPTGVSAADVVIVAGGGSAGYGQRAGGGGAGEVLYPGSSLSVSAGQQLLIDVGAGGTFNDSTRQGNDGANSRFGYFEALGGGAGGGGNTGYAGQDGGSGGGAARCSVTTEGQSLSTDRYSQFVELGNNGGSVIGSCNAVEPGAGGGGAGSAGNNSGVDVDNSGAGGTAVKIFGRVLAGGGAAWNSGTNLGGGLEGTRVGGSWGGFKAPANNGVNGTGSGASSSGIGGSGIIVVRYAQPSATLTLDNQGSTSTATVIVGENPTDPSSSTTREGYSLAGWSDDDDNNAEYAVDLSDYTMGSSNDTVYAVWTANDNTVTFIANYGSGIANKTQTIVTDQSTALNQSFSRTGYSFVEWTTESAGTGDSYTLTESVSIKGDLDLYAQWSADTYTLTFDYDGGTGSPATADYTTDAAPVTLPNPVKSGYTFDGWYSDSGKTSKITGPTHTITADSTIYAKWATATFTILYEYNGRDGGDSTVSDTYTTEATGITLPVPTRTGYNFGGWFETSDFASGTEATSAYTTTANRTLYAKWNAIDYTVTYDVNGGTGTVPTDSNNYNYLDDVPVAGPGAISRTGYNFTGWTVASNGSGTVLNSGDTFEMGTSNVTLYAKWAGKTYTVTYNTNGATGSPARTSDTYTVDQSSAIVAPGVGTMQKLGYTFTGWSASATGTGSTANITPTADTQLYAIWELKTINISYDSGTIDAGILSTMPSDVTGTKKYGETFTLDSLIDDPVSSGGSSYKFFGWKDGSNTVYEKGETVILGANDYTFTAQWVETFAVRYALNGGTGVALYDSECLETGNKCTAVQDPITLSNAPSRDGYTFTGWLDSAGNSHAAGASLKINSNNYLLYAQWTAIDYTLSFDEAGGSTTRSDIVGNISENKQLPAAPGSKTGYSFLGWSDGSVVYGAQTVFTIGSADVDFTAVWEPDVYTVAYDWRGGAGSPQADDSYTVGTGTLSLPSQGDRTRDGFVFGGWSETAGGSALSAFTPTSDTTLYAVWNNGNYALTFDLSGGTGVPTSALVPRTESRVFPEPTREGFVLTGWFDSDSGGNKLGDAGDSFTPTSSRTYHAQWVQRSLFGVDLATLNGSYSSTLTADESNPNPISSSLDDGTTKATVSVPQGSLPTGTKINVQYFRDTARQSSLIPGENNYFFSVLVSWLLGTGDTATVPDTDPSIPIVVTLENSQIKAGARIYQVIGTQVTDLGVATVDGEVTVELYEDPEIVVAATRPDAPTAVSATAGDQQATVSWTPPSDNGGEAITGYTVTSTPGSLTCTSATTTCVVTGLTNSTAYTFTVTATNSVGTSDASTASNSVTPATTIYTVTFNSNGGSNVASQTFPDGDPLTAPANPTKSGYNFAGWSTVLDDADTKIDFNSPPNVTADLVLYALWTAVVSGGSGGGGISGSGDANPEVSVIPNAIPGGQTSFTLAAGGQATAASIEGFELPISMTANGVTLEIPSDVPAGTYDLTLTIDGTEYVYLSALTVVSEEEFGAMTYWTKRISQTEVKVYIKNPELGAKYRILHQTGGSGSYETIFVKTIESTTDSSLRFNSQGRYIVRTIDLSEINRIRIRIDDDEVWKVRYNNYSDTPFITTSTNPLVSLWGRVVRLFS